MNSWSDSFKALFFGPGWQPGTPRLGDPNAVPDHIVRPKYNPKSSTIVDCYLLLHFIIVIYLHQTLTVHYAVSNFNLNFYHKNYIF